MTNLTSISVVGAPLRRRFRGDAPFPFSPVSPRRQSDATTPHVAAVTGPRFRRHLPRGRPGATRAELLVGLALLAILTTLLSPAWSQASTDALQERCLANLKRIGEALQLYAKDNNGFLPPARTTDGGWIWWTTYLADHAGVRNDPGSDLYTCPAAPDEMAGNDDPKHTPPTNYGYNLLYYEGSNAPKNPKGCGTFRNLHLIDNPGEKHVVLDWHGKWGPIYDNECFQPGLIRPRHNGRTNLLYVDGHVETHDPVADQRLLAKQAIP